MQQQPIQQQQLRSCGAFRKIINPMFTFQQIYKAYLDCRRNKRNTPDALAFECNQEENLIQLVEALNDRSYRPATSVCFYIEKPKAREIFAAAFRDRIVHHLIYMELAQLWERKFIDQSFACRPNKGTHKAEQVLQSYTRKATLNGKKPAYYLKMDLQNFFMSINKHVLSRLLCKKCSDTQLRWLLQTVIFHDPTQDFEMVGSDRMKEKLPKQKSLFHVLEDCGLAIGNLTSQFFANVYLNPLDQFVKHTLKCRFYVRYVDDFILIAVSKGQLLFWQEQIIHFLERELLLRVNFNATKIDTVFNGIDFVGFIIRPFYKLCRRRVIGNCKTRLANFQSLLVLQDDSKTVWKYDQDILEKLLAIMNSYLGHFRHAHTHKIIEKLLADFPFLQEYFIYGDFKLSRKHRPPKKANSLKQQVHYFNRLFAGHLLLFQVGCYYEAYGEAAKQLSATLGYQIKNQWRGFQTAGGFHQRYLHQVCSTLEQHKIPYTIVEQTGRFHGSTIERVPRIKVAFQIANNHNVVATHSKSL